MNTKWILCICALAAALGGCASTQSPEAPTAPPPAQDPAPATAATEEAPGGTRVPSMEGEGAAAPAAAPPPDAPTQKKPTDAKQKGGIIVDD